MVKANADNSHAHSILRLQTEFRVSLFQAQEIQMERSHVSLIANGDSVIESVGVSATTMLMFFILAFNLKKESSVEFKN